MHIIYLGTVGLAHTLAKLKLSMLFLKMKKKKREREEERKVDTFWTGLLSNSTELLEEPINHSDLDTWRYCNLTVKE
jgi:hypothetical protein